MTDLASIRLPDINHRKRIPMRAIRTVVKFIVEKFDPEKVILFGSYAYGRPGPASDVDLLVVMDTELTERQQRLMISRALSPHPFSMDVLVRTPRNLLWRLEQGDYFLREVVGKGKVIYERPDRRVDTKGRE